MSTLPFVLPALEASTFSPLFVDFDEEMASIIDASSICLKTTAHYPLELATGTTQPFFEKFDESLLSTPTLALPDFAYEYATPCSLDWNNDAFDYIDVSDIHISYTPTPVTLYITYESSIEVPKLSVVGASPTDNLSDETEIAAYELAANEQKMQPLKYTAGQKLFHSSNSRSNNLVVDINTTPNITEVIQHVDALSIPLPQADESEILQLLSTNYVGIISTNIQVLVKQQTEHITHNLTEHMDYHKDSDESTDARIEVSGIEPLTTPWPTVEVSVKTEQLHEQQTSSRYSYVASDLVHCAVEPLKLLSTTGIDATSQAQFAPTAIALDSIDTSQPQSPETNETGVSRAAQLDGHREVSNGSSSAHIGSTDDPSSVDDESHCTSVEDLPAATYDCPESSTEAESCITAADDQQAGLDIGPGKNSDSDPAIQVSNVAESHDQTTLSGFTEKEDGSENLSPMMPNTLVSFEHTIEREHTAELSSTESENTPVDRRAIDSGVGAISSQTAVNELKVPPNLSNDEATATPVANTQQVIQKDVPTACAPLLLPLTPAGRFMWREESDILEDMDAHVCFKALDICSLLICTQSPASIFFSRGDLSAINFYAEDCDDRVTSSSLLLPSTPAGRFMWHKENDILEKDIGEVSAYALGKRPLLICTQTHTNATRSCKDLSLINFHAEDSDDDVRNRNQIVHSCR